MQKVLIITYYWPPGSGAGVQRWLKFSKYLPDYDIEPLILTVDPRYATYPATDNSLNAEISSDLKVYKTRAVDYFRLYTKDKSRIPSAGFAANKKEGPAGIISRFIRGNFFIPDPRKGWNRFAFRKACGLVESENLKSVITTSPPHSTQLIGLKLKKKYPHLRWIADLRDPWTDIYYYRQFFPTSLSQKIDSHYERAVLTSADKVITIGDSLKELFISKVPGLKNRIEVISNGYDEEDFSGRKSFVQPVFTISYIGTLSDLYPVRGFLEALSAFSGTGGDYRLRFAGMVTDKQKENILLLLLPGRTEFIPYVEHSMAIDLMINSNALLLVIPDHPGNRCIITGKLFEYLASCRPVICLGPVDGDAARILEKTGHGKAFGYDDVAGITHYLGTLAMPGNIPELPPAGNYRRDVLVRQVVSLLR